MNNNNSNNSNNNNNSVTKNNNLKTSHQHKIRQQNLNRQQSMPSGKNLKQMGENAFLAQLQQQQMVLNRSTSVLTSSTNSQSPFDSADGSQFVSSSPAITLAPASSSSTIQTDSSIDPELNDILENLFDDGSYNEDPAMNFIQNVNNFNSNTNSSSTNSNSQLKQQEELAQINKIQQSLMECEDEANFSGSPPAYPLGAMTAQARLQQSSSYVQPPPGYNQQRNTIRPPQMSVSSNNSSSSSSNIVTNSNTTAATQSTSTLKPIPPGLIERYRVLQQQQLEQKHRLLQQQQNQQIVVTAGADQICKLLEVFESIGTNIISEFF